MSLDAAAKRALFDALDPPLPRARRGASVDLEGIESRQFAGDGQGRPARARSARAGGLVPIEQSGRNPASQSEDSAPVDPRAALDLFVGRQLRGRWIHGAAYQGLRNAAWMVRQSRVGGANNPLALQLAVLEVKKLLDAGEKLFDVIEAFAELLVHP